MSKIQESSTINSMSTTSLTGTVFPFPETYCGATRVILFEGGEIICPVPVRLADLQASIPVTTSSEETITSEESKETEKLTCPECDRKFKSHKGLQQHIGKIHSDKEKLIKCQQCSKVFLHKYALKFHVNQVHLKKTRVECENCGRDFYNKYTLKNHLRDCGVIN